MRDVLCFEVNNWYKYPKFFDEWFDFESDKHEGQNWIKDLDAYAKENRLCIKVVCVDMSVSLVVTAPKSWVKEHITEFTDEELENFKSNVYGCPSGELFLDWTGENYGAQEWIDGKPYREEK